MRLDEMIDKWEMELNKDDDIIGAIQSTGHVIVPLALPPETYEMLRRKLRRLYKAGMIAGANTKDAAIDDDRVCTFVWEIHNTIISDCVRWDEQ